MYLVDTNVISEARARANAGVRRFLSDAPPDDGLYLSEQTLGELRRVVERLRNRGDEPQARWLEDWLDILVADYADRILDFDADCAQVWGKLMAPSPQHPIDKQLAAVALIYDLVVVTRNTGDFGGTGAALLDSFR